MRPLLLALLLVISQFLFANTYYFSTSSGDDSRTPAQAQNPSTPWKTVGKLNSYFSSLQPGDFVLFKRGETFYGGIVVNKSGTSGNPITIGAYGSGDKPIITGMSKLSNWVSIGGGIWESYNSSLGSSVNVVTINSAPQTMGRFPNKNARSGGYLHFESHSGTSSITDNELSSSPSWTGGELVIRTSRWVLDRVSITGHSGGTLSYVGDNNEPKNNYGYFIQDHIKTLDQEGEWYYKPSTKKMHLYNGSSTPSNVEASSIENIVYGSSKSYITFDNLQFKGSNGTNINLGGGGNIIIRNCDVFSSGVNGINVTGGNSLIENSTVTNSYNDGIVATGSGTIVRNNVIRNSLYDAGKGLNGNGKGAGIRQGSDVLIEYNQVYNSGYVGIHMGGDNSIIKNNLVDGFSFIKDDGGGIYSSNGHNVNKSGRKIIGNIILNAVGAGYGTSNKYGTSAEGIYMDDNENGIEINGNTVANISNRGIYVHNTRDIDILNNTMFNNGKGLEMKQDRSIEPVRDHTVKGNIFYNLSSEQVLMHLQTNQNNIASFGTFDNNFFENRVGIYNEYVDGSKIKMMLDMEAWKNKYGEDQNSKFTPSLPLYKLNSLKGINKFLNGNFDIDVFGIGASGSSLSWEKSLKLDGGYAKVKPAEKNTTLVMNIGSLDKSKKYIVRFSAITDHSGIMSLGVNFRQGSSGSATMSNREYVTMTNKRANYEMVLEPTQNELSSNLVFVVDETATYYIDNIQVYEADVTIKSTEDNILFEYNASKSSKTIPLSDNYIDVKRNKYSGSVVLQPYSSIILWIDTTTGTTTNSAPTVSITSPSNNKSFTAPASIAIKADASDADGTISKVEFFAGTKLIGTKTSSPYSFTWSNVSSGTYSLTAKATDNKGLSKTSEAVSINVETISNTAPNIAISNPVNNTSYSAPASISINANTSDPDGTISKVEFFAGTKLIGTKTSGPYSITWSNVASGIYSITAKATDNDGHSTTSSAIILSVVSLSNIGDDPTQTINEIIPYGSGWNYLDNGSNQGTDWRSSSYNDDAWKIGKGLLGYGNENEATIVNYGSNSSLKYITTYFRKTIDIPDTSKYTDYTLNLRRDDGAVVYINGKEVFRTNLPEGTINYNTLASLASDDGHQPQTVNITNSELKPGLNIIAVEVHQANSWSSDLAFDLELIGHRKTAFETAPSVNIISPLNNSTFTAKANIAITATTANLDKAVSKVEYYNESMLIGTATKYPYTIIWENVNEGKYPITAVVTVDGGENMTSSPITIKVTPSGASTTKILSYNAEWKYLDDGSDQETAWTKDSYDHNYWKSGRGLFGYGNGNENTVVEYGDHKNLKHITTYFRKRIDIDNISEFTDYVLNIRRDDGAVVYINGVEVFRTNMPEGMINYHTVALNASDDGHTPQSISLPASLFQQGSNLIAVEVHQFNTWSSDLAFDLELYGYNKNSNVATTANQEEVLMEATTMPTLLKTTDFSLAPNPATNNINISLVGFSPDQPIQISLLSMSGNRIKDITSSTSTNLVSVDISSLPKGIYIISVVSGEFRANKQFVKQ